jgi:hypothetical protein
LGRLFRDAAGRANQVAARHAREVILLVSGLPVMIKPQGATGRQPSEISALPSERELA